MMTKKQPLGACDLCREPFPSGVSLYTSKRKPRQYCSRDCRNTANSRAGSAIRSAKVRRRIAAGEWQNPADLHRPDPANIAAGVSRARKREVQEGRWRNPALTAEAREKLSRPRKHTGALHCAIEKYKRGCKTSELTVEEHQAYLAYRAELRRERRARMTDEEREAQRAKWRTQSRQRRQR